MPDEQLIAKWEELLSDMVAEAGKAEQTRIDLNLQVVDASPSQTALSGYIIVSGGPGGSFNGPALKVPGITYTNGDLVNVVFKQGTEPVAFQQGSGSSGTNGGAPTDAQYLTLATNTTLTAERVATAGHAVKITDAGAGSTATIDSAWEATNSSGGTVSAGDVGYIDADGAFYTTTTASFFDENMVAVVIGGADSSTIYVNSSGVIDLNYTGTAPSTGDFIVTTTTAGKVSANLDVSGNTFTAPEIIAVALENGSGGVCRCRLLMKRETKPLFNSNYIKFLNSISDSDFVALIDSLPGGTAVRYDTPTSGAENVIVPQSSSELAKMRLYNSTRGTYALISSVNTTGGAGYDGEITVTDSADISGWMATDSITVRSQTNTSTFGSGYYFDFEFTSTISDLAVGFVAAFNWRDTAAAGSSLVVHPWLTFAVSKAITIANPVTTINGIVVTAWPLYAKRWTMAWDAGGSGTGRIILLILGQIVAAP